MRSLVVPSCVHGMPGVVAQPSTRHTGSPRPMDAGARNAWPFAGGCECGCQIMTSAEPGLATNHGNDSPSPASDHETLDTWRKDPMPKRMALRVIPSPQAQELVREGYEKTVDALLANLAMQDSLKRQVLIFGSALGYDAKAIDAKAIDADIQTLKAA